MGQKMPFCGNAWFVSQWQKNENCQNRKLLEFEFVRIGNCQNWNLSELEFVRIGNCQNWNLSE